MSMSNPYVSLKTASILSFGLAIIKGIGFWYTGSMLVFASLLDSVGDSFISWLNSRISRAASAQADRKHPYGHGGFEVIGSFVQGGVISIAAGILIFESLQRAINPATAAIHMNSLEIGAMALAVSALGGGLVTLYLRKKRAELNSNQQRSLALESDIAHYTSDVWSNSLGFCGLMGVLVTGLQNLDSYFGLAAGGFMAHSAYPIIKAAFNDILHAGIEPKEQAEIKAKIQEADERILGVHRLRARRLGPMTFTDFHMKLPSAMPLEEAHHIEMKVCANLRKTFPNMDIYIHLDPDSEPDDELFT